MLVDQYLANLRAYGVMPNSKRAVGSCASDLYPGTPQPIDDEVVYPRYACSAGGATGGLPILLGAFAALGLRRRRR
jgi:MYXO-CTERM domain-containing protein